MARAGDGKVRSERRKAVHSIAFRLTDEQLSQLKGNSANWGYENPRFFARDIALYPDGIPIRKVAQLRVRLARLHAEIENLLRRSPGLDKDAELKAIMVEVKAVFADLSGDDPG